MVFLFDHPGFIQRSLATTQVKDESGRVYTDVEKWYKFSRMYVDYLNNISLLVSSGNIAHQRRQRLLMGPKRGPYFLQQILAFSLSSLLIRNPRGYLLYPSCGVICLFWQHWLALPWDQLFAHQDYS